MNNYRKILRISQDSGVIFEDKNDNCTIFIPVSGDNDLKLFYATTILISMLIFPEQLFGQNTISFENQGWSSNQSLPQNFTTNGYAFSSNEPFYTNYGYNFDVNGVSLYYVFQNPSSDAITITFPDHTIGTFASFAAYQVSETSTTDLIVEGWAWSSLKFTQSFPPDSIWTIHTMNYDFIDKIIIRLAANGAGGLTDYNFDNFSFTGIVTATEGDTTNTIPKNYALSQNYPNPFNPSTVISYKIARPGNVVLEVYDILGKEVATLVNQQQAAGNYSVRFNAANLSSGIYIYVLQSGGMVLRNKMILLK
jgi:Secretion system C-terminal sorting domain